MANLDSLRNHSMPQNLKYNTILQYVSSDRIDSYRNTFSHADDAEIYGAYIWSQHASASFYPILQNLEVTLRNAIDNEAKRRFGDYWWQVIGFTGDRGDKQNVSAKFFNKIKAAENSLKAAWRKKEKNRLGIATGQQLPADSIMPIWTHNQIVAATEFAAWEFILVDAFSSNIRAEQKHYLFPNSMSKIFKNYAQISNKPNDARQILISLIREIREYRNRLFHHEPLWIKSSTVTNDKTAIDTIRKKINRAELIITAINLKKAQALDKVGIFSNARRICSIEELNIYTYKPCQSTLTVKQRRNIRKLLRKTGNNQTLTFEYDGSVYGLYKFR